STIKTWIGENTTKTTKNKLTQPFETIRRPSWGGNSLPKTGTFSAPSSNTRTTILSNLDSKQQQGVSTAGIQHCWKDRAESSHEAKVGVLVLYKYSPTIEYRVYC
ncbi:hypothetical protein F442_23055, partial [Phytophthora nicotianae P10297]